MFEMQFHKSPQYIDVLLNWCKKLPFLVVTFLNITQHLNTGLYFIQVHLMFPFYFFQADIKSINSFAAKKYLLNLIN